MHRTKEEVERYIEKLFSDRSLFELKVLHVSSHYDRLEIMKILAQIIVRERLKEEINFLYIKSYKDFNLSQIVNILFHEIANEWLSFAIEILHNSKEEAINELQNKTRVKFLHLIVSSYYETYRRFIFEVIADTFIELVNSIKDEKETNRLVEEVLQSDLIKNRQILKLHNFYYLWHRVKEAQNIKNSDIINANIKIHEIENKCEKADINDRDIFVKSLKKHKEELEELKTKELDEFDSGIKRLKDSMVNTMLRMSQTT